MHQTAWPASSNTTEHCNTCHSGIGFHSLVDRTVLDECIGRLSSQVVVNTVVTCRQHRKSHTILIQQQASAAFHARIHVGAGVLTSLNFATRSPQSLPPKLHTLELTAPCTGSTRVLNHLSWPLLLPKLTSYIACTPAFIARA